MSLSLLLSTSLSFFALFINLKFFAQLLIILLFQFTKADLSLSVYPVLAALASYNRYSFNNFQCCGSRMFIPDPGSEFFPSRIHVKKFQYFNQNVVSKLSEIWSCLFILILIFYTSRIQESKSHRTPDPGFGSATLIMPKKHFILSF